MKVNYEDMRTSVFTFLCEIETLVYTLEEIYANSVLVDQLNNNAGAFFAQHQALLIDKIIIEIAKLFDPDEDRQGNKNVSLRHLVRLAPESTENQEILNKQWGKAKLLCKKTLIIRHKVLCHNDCSLLDKNIGVPLSVIKETLVEVKLLFDMCCGSAHYRLKPNIYPARTLKNWVLG
ncbi:hypothetical protein KIK84_06725 [Curvibacter sp. CHRR-16]|uniref:AbiU2 domain-containing protein n=1 Tax=Curvibacter sp. CHRR-16 TaxID=2835872 RepID=UPI001BDA79FE|nr:hypothetical protein [Curvibacter sp. CHRR-16]MBT0570013.1 hypothetical protein [Curvibacter sp. CHRR-16]